MADLLGSILGTMDKPPTIGEEERKKKKAMEHRMEKIKEQERQQINVFRSKTQKEISEFVKDPEKKKIKYAPMNKVFRSIVHEVAETAGLTSFSFGEEEVDRHLVVWKKEHAPTDDELSALRRGEEYDPEKAKRLAAEKAAAESTQEHRTAVKRPHNSEPVGNAYQNKLNSIMARGKEELEKHAGNERSYGMVSAENKKDRRTIEQVMADNRAKKMKKEEPTS